MHVSENRSWTKKRHWQVVLSTTLVLLFGSQAVSVQAEQSVSVGVSYPSGLVGVNYDWGMNEYLHLHANLGYGYDLAWNLGARYFPLGDNIGPRLTALYGTSTILDTRLCRAGSCETVRRYYTGLTVGAGWSVRTGAQSMAVDVLYVVESDAEDDINRWEQQGYDVETRPSRVNLLLSYGF